MAENLPDTNVGNIEYIRKQDAIAVAESYQVERTGFYLNDYEYGRNQVADSIASDLEDIKPADVVKVVRCKDCKYNATTHKCLNPDSFFLIPKDDDFCSYGEKREG